MKQMFEPAVLEEIRQRINSLHPGSQRQWGKMDVSQMMAHCRIALEAATGEKTPKRMFIGKVLGPLFKSHFYNEKPFNKNGPTDKTFIVADKRDFEKEKTRLLEIIERFSKGGAAKCTTEPHSFFGKLTPEQWATGMYKHLDHHLRQFNA